MALAPVRKPAVKKVAVKTPIKPNDGDKVAITLVGYWDDSNEFLVVDENEMSELYLNLDSKGVTVEILEPGVQFEPDDVIKDAEGCIFVLTHYDGWQGVSDRYCSTPTRPFTKATFA